MSDRVEIPCPGCGRVLRVRPEYFGFQIICKYCATDFIAHAPPPAPHVVSWPEETRTAAPAAGGDGLRNELAALQNRVEDAERERQELREAIATLRQELAAFRSALDRRFSELAIDQESINAADPKDSTEDVRRQVENLSAELAQARAETDRVQATLVELGIRIFS